MKTYKKPIISIDSGLAEGVYSASGTGSNSSNNTVTFSSWYKVSALGNSGQLGFSADFSKVNNLSQLTLKIKFNHPIEYAWVGDGAPVTIKGNEISFSWYNAPEKPMIYIQVFECLSTLAITGYSCTNA